MPRRLDLDEDDVRVRPGRGTRPRSRQRPAHEQAVPAVVTAVDRGRFACATDDGPVVAVRARELGRRGVVVGDEVALLPPAGADDLGRVVRVELRRSVLRRTAEDGEAAERVVVANADQLVVVAAVADPEPRTGFVDRCLVAAYDAGLTPLLCLTKTDLGDGAEFLAGYAALGVPHVSWRRGDDPAPVADRLHGLTSVFIGHSGVGKSTLVNALAPQAGRRTGRVNAVTGRGRHTSTSAIAIPLPGGGWVVDTPGVRGFGLAHVSAADLLRGFPDLAPLAETCPPGCDHSGRDPYCALSAEPADPARVASFRRLLDARSGRD